MGTEMNQQEKKLVIRVLRHATACTRSRVFILPETMDLLKKLRAEWGIPVGEEER